MIKTIYWDLGGVCVTDNLNVAFMAHGLEYGAQQKTAWAEHRLGKTTTREFFKSALKGTPLEQKVEEVSVTAREYIKVKPNGALPIIMRLNGVGNYKQGVISNHSKEWGQYMREVLGIHRHFDQNLFIISADVGLDKTGTDIFSLALQKAGTKPEETLFWDNQESNVQMARKAGLNSELFVNRDQAAEILRSKYGIKVYQNGGR